MAHRVLRDRVTRNRRWHLKTLSAPFFRRLFLCTAVALLPTAVLPIYPHRTLTRSTVIGGDGDKITLGFRLSTLPAFFAARRYMRPEESPVATTIANVLFWISIAGSCGLAGAWFWSRRRAAP